MEQGPTGGVTPYITITAGTGGGRAAVAFYERAFGATAFAMMPGEDGERLMHAHLGINGGSVMLSDDFPEYGGGTGKPEAVTLHLQVDDADAWFNRAVEAGCTVKMPLADQFWGDRYGQLLDPYGHSWSIGAPVRG